MAGGVSRHAPPGPPTSFTPYHLPAGAISAIAVAAGLVVLGGIALVCWCCWKIRSASSGGHDGPGAGAGAGAGAGTAVAAGVELTAVAAQSLVAFPPPQHAGEEPEEMCYVCLNNFAAGDELRQLRCLHYFHRHCLAALTRPYCPTCRAPIVTSP